MFTSTFAVLLVCITLPIIFLLWLTESQHTKVKRMYKTKSYTQQQLADIFGAIVDTTMTLGALAHVLYAVNVRGVDLPVLVRGG